MLESTNEPAPVRLNYKTPTSSSGTLAVRQVYTINKSLMSPIFYSQQYESFLLYLLQKVGPIVRALFYSQHP